MHCLVPWLGVCQCRKPNPIQQMFPMAKSCLKGISRWQRKKFTGTTASPTLRKLQYFLGLYLSLLSQVEYCRIWLLSAYNFISAYLANGFRNGLLGTYEKITADNNNQNFNNLWTNVVWRSGEMTLQKCEEILMTEIAAAQFTINRSLLIGKQKRQSYNNAWAEADADCLLPSK